MKAGKIGEIEKEVDRMTDGLGMFVDKRIKPLVVGLRRWGVKTISSCQGHNPPHGYPFPWVLMYSQQARLASKIVSWQNRPVLPNKRKNKNLWVLKPLGNMLRLIPEDKKSLAQLQRDAEEFGRFLQELPDDWGA